MLNIHTILFGTDFSPDSDYAFSLATALARDYKSRMVIVHVREVPVAPVGEFGFLPSEAEDVEEAKERLYALQPDEATEVEHVLANGVAGAELLRLAEEFGCDLIVVGSHGHTGLARLLMGSVAERVVRGAHCPVLVVKRPEAQRVAEQKTEAAVA
jgi:nucleotide-binding universal stress UspA family protein